MFRIHGKLWRLLNTYHSHGLKGLNTNAKTIILSLQHLLPKDEIKGWPEYWLHAAS